MLQGKKRIAWIDTIKYFCIYFVMLSHLGRNELIRHLGCFFNPFYLTGFLFASGYTFHYQPGFLTHLHKKAKQLLLPWLTFSLFCILTNSIFTLDPQGRLPLATGLFRNFLQIRGYGDEMWFVSALFVSYIPFYFFIRSYERVKMQRKATIKFFLCTVILYCIYGLYMELMPKSILPGGLNGLPWHLEYTLFAMLFLFLGYLFREKYEARFDRNNTPIVRFSILLVYLFYVYVPVFLNVELPLLLKIPDLFIKNILGLAVLISFGKAFTPNALSDFAGQNTLIYFGLHGKLVSLLEAIFRHLAPTAFAVIYGRQLYSIPYALIMGLLLAVLLVPPTIIIKKFFPFMIGQHYKKNR